MTYSGTCMDCRTSATTWPTTPAGRPKCPDCGAIPAKFQREWPDHEFEVVT